MSQPLAPIPPLPTEPARRILRGMQRYFLESYGVGGVPEVTLATGRRVDFMAVDRKGLIWVIEIKSCLADYRSDAKWQTYLEYCDRFAFAVDEAFPQEVLPPDVGLFVADGYGADCLRDPVHSELAGARRKAVMLRYALTAAARLTGVDAPPP